MELTGIGKENISAFEPLMAGLSLDDHDLAIGAIEDGTAAGVALYNRLGDALMLDYIYVDRKFRRRGIGRALIEKTLSMPVDPVPAALHVNFNGDAEEMHSFFLALGFRLLRDGVSWRVPAMTMLDSATFRKLVSGNPKFRVMQINSLTAAELGVLKRGMEGENLDPTILDDKKLSPLLSLATIDTKTGRPVACILCEQECDRIVILYLVNYTHDVRKLVDIFRAAKNAVIVNNLDNNDLFFVTMDKKMEALAGSLSEKSDELRNRGKVISAIRMYAGYGNDTTEDSGEEIIANKRLTAQTADPRDPEEYTLCFTLRALAKSQRTKRGKRFESKAGLQATMLHHMLGCLKSWESFGYDDPPLRLKGNDGTYPRDRMLALFSTCVTPGYDERAYLRRDHAYYMSVKGGLSDGLVTESVLRSEIFEALDELDLTIFNYDTDEEYIIGRNSVSFEKRFALLRLLSHSKRLIEECSEDDELSELASKLRKKADLILMILRDYEIRGIIIQSPYYSLLAAKDFDSLPESDLEVRIKQTEDLATSGYLKQVLKVRGKAGFTRGVPIEKFL